MWLSGHLVTLGLQEELGVLNGLLCNSQAIENLNRKTKPAV